MRILGIDCGTERTGYGIVDSDGRVHRMVTAGVIRTDAKAPLERRLLAIGSRLREVIREFRPDAAAVEDVFVAANVRSGLKLAHVRGAALMLLAESELPVGSYSPLEVKTSVVGYGRAGKEQVQVMVRNLLRLDSVIDSEDASDALAVAICHATRAFTARRIAEKAR